MMIFFWFPGELFFIDGGWQGLKLVAAVDLILGPALTLLLYKPGKPKLALDMSMIAIIQLSALAYGFYATHQQRTVAIVYAEKAFYTLSANDNKLADEELRKLSMEPKPLPAASLLQVPLMLTPEPTRDEFASYLEELLNGYPGPQQRSDRYISLAAAHNSIRANALSRQQLEDRNALQAVEASLARHDRELAQVEVHDFTARYATGVAILDPENLKILDYVALDSTVPATQSADDVVAEDTAAD